LATDKTESATAVKSATGRVHGTSAIR
jgi:hypothetical protein